MDDLFHTAESVISRLEEAGRTLICLPSSKCLPSGMAAAWPDFPNLAIEAYGWLGEVTRAPVPSSAAIDRMDEAFCWVGHIPSGQTSIRRIVLLRSLVHPITDRHLWSWRRIGAKFGWSHQAVSNWHERGIDAMVQNLNLPLAAAAKKIEISRLSR